MIYDVFIFGAGAAGVSCALVLGSAQNKDFVKDKKIGIIAHQKASYLQNALLNNVCGVAPGTLGKDFLENTLEGLAKTYPHIEQIKEEKVISVEKNSDGIFLVKTTNGEYQAINIVVAVNSNPAFQIEGLMQYVVSHKKSHPSKNRIQLENENYIVDEGIYVAGTISGHRSQVAIAIGSGAEVATDILVKWNNGEETQAHDSIKK